MLAVIGALVMAGSVAADGDTWRTIGCGVYLASLIIVYAMSTLSHIDHRTALEAAVPAARPGIHLPLDRRHLHAVFAGLLADRPVVGAAGRDVDRGHRRLCRQGVLRPSRRSRVPRLVHGAGLDADHGRPGLDAMLPLGAFWWMVAAALCYTVGTLFLMNDERVRHFHAVWHLCVIAGSVCHFLGILIFVV